MAAHLPRKALVITGAAAILLGAAGRVLQAAAGPRLT